MGSGASKPPQVHSQSYAASSSILTRFESLRISLALTKEELSQLFVVFCQWNTSETGVLTETEMGIALDWKGEALERRLFALLKDSPQGASFRSFLVRFWSYLATDMRSLSLLAFQLFNVSNDGVLNLADVRLMFQITFGPKFQRLERVNGIYKRLVKKDSDDCATSAYVPLDKFLALVSHAQHLLEPVYKVQRNLQRATLGVRKWDAATARRHSASANFDIAIAATAANAALGYFNPNNATAQETPGVGARLWVDARRKSNQSPFFIVFEHHLIPPKTLRGAAQPCIELEGLATDPNHHSAAKPRDHLIFIPEPVDEPSLFAFGIHALLHSTNRACRFVVSTVHSVHDAAERHFNCALAAVAPAPTELSASGVQAARVTDDPQQERLPIAARFETGKGTPLTVTPIRRPSTAKVRPVGP